jgi:hypothetical protein
MPAEYCQQGLRILYPENWQLAELDSDDETLIDLSLETPEGWLMLIQASPLESSPPAESLFEEMASGLEAQYDDVEFSDCTRKLGIRSTDGREALFFCLDSLVQARMLVLDTSSHRVAALYQFDSRQVEKMEPVFEAILTGMLMSPAQAASR